MLSSQRINLPNHHMYVHTYVHRYVCMYVCTFVCMLLEINIEYRHLLIIGTIGLPRAMSGEVHYSQMCSIQITG